MSLKTATLREGFQSLLELFVDTYTGHRLVLVTTGGGGYLNLISTVPGSSRVFHSSFTPYAESAAARYVGVDEDSVPKSVSEEMALLYRKAAIRDIIAEGKNPDEFTIIVITAALMTTHWKKGTLHAYVTVGDRLFHVTFPAQTEDEYNAMMAADGLPLERVKQDLDLCLLAMREAGCNELSDIPWVPNTALSLEVKELYATA